MPSYLLTISLKYVPATNFGLRTAGMRMASPVAGSAFNGTEAAEADESHGIAHRNGGHDFFKNAHDDTVSFSFGNVVACGNAVNEVETIHLNTPGGSARPRQLKGMWLRGRRIFLGVALKNQGSA